MIKEKRVLAIIPARAGSKRVKNKNIKELGEKPLVTWTIKAAKESKYIDEIFVSTDSVQIQKIAKGLNVEADPLRSDELSSDTAASVDVVLDIINNIKTDFDIIVLLQPTSPFRTTSNIDEALELYFQKKAKSVVSVCAAECDPSWVGPIPEDLKLDAIVENLKLKRSQEFSQHYRLNGAIYISGKDEFQTSKTFYHKSGSFSYIMDRANSIDIDTEEDFELAKLMLSFLN